MALKASGGVGAAKGFTLIEIMIVVIILSVLVMITLPAYSSYVQKSRRGDAKSSLLGAQLKQEKWRANHLTYGALADVWGADTSSRNGYYTIAVVGTPDGVTFVMSATPTGAQSGDDCGTFAVNQNGPLYAGYASADCWGR